MLIRVSWAVGELGSTGADVVMISVAKAFSLIWLSWVVGELVKNSELSWLGVAAKLEFMLEQMTSSMKSDATKNCLEDRLSISLCVCECGDL